MRLCCVHAGRLMGYPNSERVQQVAAPVCILHVSPPRLSLPAPRCPQGCFGHQLHADHALWRVMMRVRCRGPGITSWT